MCHVRQKQKWHNLNLLCISSNAQDKLSIEPKFSALCDEFHVIRSSLWSLTQILTVSVAHAANILTWKRVVDMTACADVKSQCKYSTKIKTESHPLIVRGCYLRHFWNQDFDIRLIWVQTSSFHTMLYHPTVKKTTLGLQGDDVELCYPLHIIAPVKCLLGGFYWIFCRGKKTANLALKIQITQFRMNECEIHVCPRLRAESV